MTAATRLSPLVSGSALAITLAVTYAVCAVLWSIWHEAAIDFLNALFHGLDFRKIASPVPQTGIAAFVLPFSVLVAWGFVTGALYAAIYNLLRER